jgi:branched-chain amino acid aminotransferase
LERCKYHVLSHVVHYGTGVFEGIRAYKNEKGVAVFRLKEHVQRLFDSAKIYKIDIPYTQEEIEEAILEIVRVNDLDGCYIRPIVFRG